MALGNTDHVPLRDSKLTHLLHHSLDANSKTLMFVNVSPSEDGAGETLNSLRLAGQAGQWQCTTNSVRLKHYSSTTRH
ncbi:kinesin-like protein KIFC1 [Amphibalanus amphitrite]|uniref:kinesin-like protein KIFC1 n=1 Tax=Amphibalanus amphitrite TaxID=1232801 RepID=UPI001C90332A|nr:kinesin-like protein KIFC1 [Amphibalanus amphitrite]